MYNSKLEMLLSERNINVAGFFRRISEKMGLEKEIPSGTYAYWVKTGKVPDEVKPFVAEELGESIETIFFDRGFKLTVEAYRGA